MVAPMEPLQEPEASAPTLDAPPGPTAITALAFFGLALVAFLVAGSLAQLSNVPFGLLWTEVFIFFIPVWLIVRGKRVQVWDWLELARPRPRWLALGLLCGLANYPIAGALEAVVRAQVAARWPAFAKKSDIAAATLGAVHGWQVAVLVIAVGVAAPLCEETAFRGLIQHGLGRALRPAQAIALTAFLFAFIHLEPIGGLARMELGVLFGVLVLWTRSVWTSIAAHMANNLFATGLFLATRGQGAPSGAPGGLQLLELFALGAVLLLPLLLWASAHRVEPGGRAPEAAAPARGELAGWIAIALGTLGILLAVGVTTGALHRAVQMAR